MDEQYGEGETIPVEDLIGKIEQLYNQVPLLYKRFVLFQDVLLILGSLKAATDFSLVGEVYKTEEFDQLKEALEAVGLKVSAPTQDFDKHGRPSRKRGHIYNPQVLKKVTTDTKFAPVYDGQMDFDQYLEESKQAGYQISGVLGKVYGFPESAIEDFLLRNQSIDKFDLLESEGKIKRTALTTGNETYWFFGDPKPDIEEREHKKDLFLSSLNNSDRYKQLEQNPTTEQSKKEWNKRVADYFNSRKLEG